MAEDLRDNDRVRAVTQKVRRARPPEGVDVDLLGQARRLRGLGDHTGDAPCAHHSAATVKPEDVGRGGELRQKFRPRLFEINAQELDRLFSKGHEPFFPALALHAQRGAVKVHVEDGQGQRLAPTDAGRVDRFQQGPVADALRAREIGNGQHALNLFFREHGPEKRHAPWGCATGAPGCRRPRSCLP